MNVTSPVPATGAIQSAVQERCKSLLWVNSPFKVLTLGPKLDHVPALATRLKPPSPLLDKAEPPSQESEYVFPGIYPDEPEEGIPLIAGEIIASVV